MRAVGAVYADGTRGRDASGEGCVRHDDSGDFAGRSPESEGPMFWAPDPHGPFARSAQRPDALETVSHEVSDDVAVHSHPGPMSIDTPVSLSPACGGRNWAA